MSPLRGWFGDLFDNHGNHYGNNHIDNDVTPTGLVGICLKKTAIITATTISRMMSPLRGWFGDLFENNGNHYGNNHI